jgi:hypothetical protein
MKSSTKMNLCLDTDDGLEVEYIPISAKHLTSSHIEEMTKGYKTNRQGGLSKYYFSQTVSNPKLPVDSSGGTQDDHMDPRPAKKRSSIQ